MTPAGPGRWGRRREDRGAAAVEFALILPVLLLLVLGIINFGYVFGQKLALNQAVREGARNAVVSTSADESAVETFVRDSTGGLIGDPTDVAVATALQSGGAGSFGGFTRNGEACVDYTDAQGLGGQLEVTATYQSAWLVPLPLSLSAPLLTSEAVFRCEVI